MLSLCHDCRSLFSLLWKTNNELICHWVVTKELAALSSGKPRSPTGSGKEIERPASVRVSPPARTQPECNWRSETSAKNYVKQDFSGGHRKCEVSPDSC